MRYYIVEAEVIGALFASLAFLGLYPTKQKGDEITNWFRPTLLSVILFSLIDALSYLLDGVVDNKILLMTINALTYIGTDVCLIFFVRYAWALMNEKQKTSRMCFRVVLFASIIDMIFVLVGTISENLFQIREGVFYYGPWDEYTGYLQMGLMIFFLIYSFSKRKIVGKTAVLSFSLYFFFPAVATIVSLYNSNYNFIYTASLFVIVIIYIVLQSGEIQNRRMKEDVMMELLRTDSLTGLRNRRDYEEVIEKMAPDEMVHVLFCDVNGLKQVNDTKGHLAGDKLLLSFSKELTQYFPSDMVFRISGDEFVVFILNGNPESLEAKIEDFKQNLVYQSWVAAVGTSKGQGRNILQIISEAEISMYQEKNHYYIATKQDRRKKISE